MERLNSVLLVMAVLLTLVEKGVQVGFNPSSYTVLEGHQVTLTIVKTGDTTISATVLLSSTGGTAIAGMDYVELTAVQVVFPPGVSTQTVTLTTIDDSIIEGPETLSANITAAQSGVDITVPFASITIVEALVQLFFVSENYEVSESGFQVRVCLALDSPLAEDLLVTVTSKESGSATGGVTDFVDESRVVRFRAGETEACTEFLVVDDSLALEGDETFVVDFEVPPGIQSGTPSSTTVTITDNDRLLVSFTEVDYVFEEGDPGAHVCLRGSGRIAKETTAAVSSVSSGTAQESLDYVPLEGTTGTFSTGTTTQVVCISVTLNDDLIMEMQESFPIKIDSVSGGFIDEGLNVTTMIIRDNDVVGVGFDPTTYFVTEGVDGSVTLTVVKTGIAAIPVTVTATTQPGTAQSDGDYTGDTVTITFQPGEAQVFVDFTIVDDDVLEDVEMFSVTLTAEDSNVDISPDTATAAVTIADNDRVSVEFDPTAYTVTEGVDGCVILSVVKTGSPDIPVTATVKTMPETAENGRDYTDHTETVTFQPGEINRRVNVTILDDDILEGVEMFTATLITSSVDISSADTVQVTIVDQDTVQVAFAPAFYSVLEGNEVNLIIIKTGDADIPVHVTLSTMEETATAGVDYEELTAVPVVFSPAVSTRTVTLTTHTDLIAEEDETLTATLTTAQSGVEILTPHAVIIIKERVGVQVQFVPASYSVLEGDQVSLTIVKTGASAEHVNVTLSTAGGTATAGMDYEELIAVSVVFSPGVSTQIVTLTTLTDSVVEGDETLNATITTAQSGVDILGPHADVIIKEGVETEEDSFPLLLIIIILTVIMALLIIVTTIIITGVLCCKRRKQQRRIAKQEIVIPEHAETSPDSKEISQSKPLEQSSSKRAPIKMQRNLVYGIHNQLGIGQGHDTDSDITQPKSRPLPPDPTPSHVMMFRLNVAYGVTGQRM